ncbi:cytidyltransferase-like domain-containing protein [Marinospirillum celere]|uniref:Cytidyltransferase-like domain-containing protein n=1 Tax=Marinospirillum celere TaxID=1122252 RepID=A0A1I1GRS4_9GAMM|nr:adenylyltransferase/cytidyltransferase family protein [Marinospirillum celere]SFC14165.1 cytidyltransferase-like domain-containing protein [Marinospirillum celere]
MAEKIKLEFLSPGKLIPGKKTCQHILSSIEATLALKGHIEEPIIVDKESNVIIKGNHLFQILVNNKSNEIPVIRTKYSSKEFVLITNEEKNINKDIYISSALNKKPLNPSDCINISLTEPQKIYYKIENCANIYKNTSLSKEQESSLTVDTLKNYIENEINSATEKIYHLKKELKRIESIREMISDSLKVGFFPGKFHPPHMGHVQTILNLLKQYKKIIIGISQDIPEKNMMTTPKEVMQTLKELFRGNEKIDIVMLDGVLVEKNDLNGLPYFDVLLSGNPDVLKWCEKMGVDSDFVSRSHGDLSSTLIRSDIYDEQQKSK